MISLNDFISGLHVLPDEDHLEILRLALVERRVIDFDDIADRRPTLFQWRVNQRAWKFRLRALWELWMMSADFVFDLDGFTPAHCAARDIMVVNPVDAAAKLGEELILPLPTPVRGSFGTLTRYNFGAGIGVSYRDEVQVAYQFFRPAYDAELAAQLARFIQLSRYYLIPVRRGIFTIPSNLPPGGTFHLYYVGLDREDGSLHRGGKLFTGTLPPGRYSIFDDRFDLPEADEDELFSGCGCWDLGPGLQYLI